MCMSLEEADVAFFFLTCFSQAVDFTSKMLYLLEIHCDTLRHTFQFICAFFTFQDWYMLALERARAISFNNFVYSKAAVSLGSKKAFLFNRWFSPFLISFFLRSLFTTKMWHLWNCRRKQRWAKLFQEISKSHYSNRCNMASHAKSWTVALFWWLNLLNKTNIFQHICLFKGCRYPFGVKVPSVLADN